MAGFSITSLEDVPDVTGDYPGEMRMAAGSIGADQVAFTWRRMPAGTGGKGSYGHRHRTQEEVYFVVSGTLEFKLEDEVIEVSGGQHRARLARGLALGLERGARRRRPDHRVPPARRRGRRRGDRAGLLAGVSPRAVAGPAARALRGWVRGL